MQSLINGGNEIVMTKMIHDDLKEDNKEEKVV